MNDLLKTLLELLKNPFILGLLIGLAISLYIHLNSVFKVRHYKKEIKNLRNHLNTKMEIESDSINNLKNELESLKSKNENLRATIQTIRAKPNRKELELLLIYDKTLQIMFEKAPGFASAWQIARKEAEKEITESYKGVIPLIKRSLGVMPLPKGSEEITFKND